MPIPKVWTERKEAPGVVGWHDCTQSATLDALIYAGHDNFPLGIYTMEERNAFEAADDRKDNTGATLPDVELAAKRRYGRTLRKLPEGTTTATFRSMLLTKGYAFIIQGWYKNFPTNLRRWDPAFGGGHCVCVISGPKPLLLDPLATDRYPGEEVDVDTIMGFAWGPPATYTRYLKEDEFIEMIYVKTIMYPVPRYISVKPGPVIPGYNPPSHDVVKQLGPITRGTNFHAAGEAFVTGWSNDPNNLEWEYWIADDGYFKGLLVPKRPDQLVPGELVDPTEAVKKELAAASEQIRKLNERVDKAHQLFGSILESATSGKAI